ncbi:unnamed protein product [Polarella glacialis]|uniref:Uncharacterized protein n=1 Tax=Polarella glacialis TaxID=89957 RepID=A0A813JS21_POLGL|nr:unnamed protein product [Polarella glacialis]CAE8683287.1 unnamed protein product [Polarella glacialis]
MHLLIEKLLDEFHVVQTWVSLAAAEVVAVLPPPFLPLPGHALALLHKLHKLIMTWIALCRRKRLCAVIDLWRQGIALQGLEEAREVLNGLALGISSSPTSGKLAPAPPAIPPSFTLPLNPLDTPHQLSMQTYIAVITVVLDYTLLTATVDGNNPAPLK